MPGAKGVFTWVGTGRRERRVRPEWPLEQTEPTACRRVPQRCAGGLAPPPQRVEGAGLAVALSSPGRTRTAGRRHIRSTSRARSTSPSATDGRSGGATAARRERSSSRTSPRETTRASGRRSAHAGALYFTVESSRARRRPRGAPRPPRRRCGTFRARGKHRPTLANPPPAAPPERTPRPETRRPHETAPADGPPRASRADGPSTGSSPGGGRCTLGPHSRERWDTVSRENQAHRRPDPEPDVDTHPRAVPCRDHAFDETLVCRCGTSWWAHQNRPRPCPDRARSRNRHSTPPCAERRGDDAGR